MVQVNANRRVAQWPSLSDRGEVPAAVEDSSEAAWQEFDACWEALEGRLRGNGKSARPAPQRTGQPQPRAMQPQPVEAPRRPTAASRLKLHDVMLVSGLNGRVCPAPSAWSKLYQLMGVLLGNAPTDPLPTPVDTAGWLRTTANQKRLRLRAQLAWAERHGGLDAVLEFLKYLREEDWHHIDEQDWQIV